LVVAQVPFLVIPMRVVLEVQVVVVVLAALAEQELLVKEIMVELPAQLHHTVVVAVAVVPEVQEEMEHHHRVVMVAMEQLHLYLVLQ
jgi:hypothetical protein